MNYIPVSLVSAFAGRHPYKPWKEAADDIISQYFPHLIESEEEIKEENQEITPEKLKEYQEVTTSVNFITPTVLTQEETSQAIKDRGIILEEDTVTRLYANPEMRDLYGVFKLCRQVQVKGSFKFGKDQPVEQGDYTLSGRIDGVIWNRCIIEIKNRCEVFSDNSYDIDQLVVYMILFPVKLPGRLIQQKDGELSIGKEITWNTAWKIWKEIKAKIDRHLKKMNDNL
jgi:hypothetical protein